MVTPAGAWRNSPTRVELRYPGIKESGTAPSGYQAVWLEPTPGTAQPSKRYVYQEHLREAPTSGFTGIGLGRVLIAPVAFVSFGW
jgi:hypothetical protein